MKKLKCYDLEQIALEARIVKERHKHGVKKYRHDDTVSDSMRVPADLLLALIEAVGGPDGKMAEKNPCNVSAGELSKPGVGDFKLTTNGYVRPGFYLGWLPSSTPEPKVFNSPCQIGPGEVTFPNSPYEFDTTVDMNNLCFTVPDSAVPLMLDLQTGHITHNGAVVGHLPHTDSSGTVSINSLTVKCHKDYSMGHVVVTDVKVNQ